MKKLSIVVAFAILFAAGSAQARSTYLSSFNTKYGTANTVLDDCNTCHGTGGTSTFNPYGSALQARMGSGIGSALTQVEPLDSDGDGFTNVVEIKALALPGDRTDTPAPTTVTCPDVDGDGYAVCDGTCVLAAGNQCGDCNDAARGVNPGAAEACTDGIDNDCNNAVDAADPTCAQAAPSDYDIASVRATGRTAVGRKATFKINVVEVTSGAATLVVTVTEAGRTTTLSKPNQAATAGSFSFAYRPSTSGTLTWSATITDEDPDSDVATASTTVK